MNVDFVEAVALLQARVFRYESKDHWRAEQAEEALNLLLAEPHRQGDAKQLVRNALADARKKLSRRAEILSLHGADIDWLGAATLDDFPHLLIEATDFLERSLSQTDQALLYFACRGESADRIAISLGIPIKRVREKLSRARARARIAAGRWSRRQRPVSSVKNVAAAAAEPASRVPLNPPGLLVSSSHRIESQSPVSQVEHRS